MPKLSDTMTDGRFIGWHKNVGERIERGDVIAEVETDKAVMELEAFASGILLKTIAKGGETVPVGTVLGLIGAHGELAEEGAPAVAAEKPEVAEKAIPQAPPQEAAPTPPVQPVSTHEPSEQEKASPLVRRLSREMGIDLAQVHGSGPEGRVLQEDLTAYATAQGKGAEPSPGPGGTVGEATTAAPETSPIMAETALPPSAMRQAIAATVTRSWREIPHFTVTVEINMTACREVIHELKGSKDEVGYNALVIKACAMALARHPRLNALSGEGVTQGEIHIGFAAALPDGLLVPVIRHCERLSPQEITGETARLAERARNGRLTSAEMAGGTFSVSNLGMYGVDEFMALIMPGQAGILAVGAVSERPAVREGKVMAAPLMRVTLSADHRVVDGAYAAAFLAELRGILEQPMRMFV